MIEARNHALPLDVYFTTKKQQKGAWHNYKKNRSKKLNGVIVTSIGKDRGVPVCPVRDEYAIDTTSFFYTSDTVVLNDLKKELVLCQRPSKDGVEYILQCGYPFWFSVFRDGQLLLKLPANIDCGYMQTSMGQMPFHSKTLKEYSKIFKPLTLRNACFNSEVELLQFIENIKKDSSYISYKVLGCQSYSKAFLLGRIQLK